jgi:hypothetical protein
VKEKEMQFVMMVCFVLAGCTVSLGQKSDAEKARNMLERAIAEVKKDPPHAFELFKNGGEGFRDGDIYPFCFNRADGVVVTGQTAGRDIRTFGDIGPKMYEQRTLPGGQVVELAYKAPKPGTDGKTLVDKVSFMGAVAAYVCGVGYYP